MVQQRIDKNALAVGNKAANLLELKALCQNMADLPVSVQIPDLHALSHELITSHLDKVAPQWQALWDGFVQEQKKAKPGGIPEPALEKLQQLRELILTTFVTTPLSTEQLEHFTQALPKQSLLMVRSTSKEDSVDLANPGGNESIAAVAPNPIAISKAMGGVIASYFSEKSLKQRLISNDDITEFPFMPVLLQRMIGEPLLGEENADAVIRSGVMYTGKSGTRIQLAPGHGELIVNSKAPFDTYFVSREQVAYSEIYRKTHRLVPIEINEQGKTKRQLELRNNPHSLQNSPSVPITIAQAIAKIGARIEQHYGMPMDVEFVYDPKDTTLYLVQARPIVKGDLKLVVPSSIPPEKLAEVKKNGQWCAAEVITPAGSAAQVITKPEELLICDTIGQALDHYLQQKRSLVKAVIVKEMAPETSHEAAQFNAKAIPVLAVEDLTPVDEWVKQNQPVIIVDPQRKQVINLKMTSIQHKNAKQDLYHAGIIKEGLFKSPMPSQLTLQPFWTKKVTTPSLESLPPVDQEQQKNIAIGDLIQAINSQDSEKSEKALQQFLQLLLHQQEELKNYPYPALPKNKVFSYLKEQVAILETAQPGQKQTDDIWRALHATLNIFYSLAKGNEGPGRDLFQQAVVTGAEIFRCLQRFTTEGLNHSTLQEEYLGLVSKLEALIINSGKKQMFSNSLHQIAQEKKAAQNAQTHPQFHTLTPTQKSYFIEFFKMGKLALNDSLKQQWTDFAFTCSTDPEKTLQLAHLVQFSMVNHVAFDVLNILFNNHCKNKLSHESILDNLMKQVNQTQSELKQLEPHKIQTILQSWERRIGEWSDPLKFNSLWNEYSQEFLPLIETLSIDSASSNLTKIATIKLVQHMTEIMDKTIKAMKGSPDYDEKVKVGYFFKLLKPYHDLMVKWVSIPEVQSLYFQHPKESALKEIQEKLTQLSNKQSISQLNPSGNFNVSSARIGSAANFQRQFTNRQLTLEDLFTLFHQNIIASTSQLNKCFGSIQPVELPQDIQPLLTELTSIKNCQYNGMSSNFPNIIIDFNLPLWNHAATFTVEYNQISKKTKLTVNFFGHDDENRMTFISDCALFDAQLCSIKEITPAAYNEKTYSLEYCWELSPIQVKELAPHIGKQIHYYTEVTYDTPLHVTMLYHTTLVDKVGQSLPYKKSMTAFKTAKKMDPQADDVLQMKDFLISFKKAIAHFTPEMQRTMESFSARVLTGIPQIKQSLSYDLNTMSPQEIHTLFYKTAIKLTELYHDKLAFILLRDNTTNKFHAEWYGKFFMAYLKLNEPKTEELLTPKTVIAKHYIEKLKPYLLTLKEKTGELFERYNENNPKTLPYKTAALAMSTLVSDLTKAMNTLTASLEPDTGAVSQCIETCSTTLNTALEHSVLIEHRGAKKGIWGKIWGTLYDLGIAIHLITEKDKEYLMSTKSAQKVMDLKATLLDIKSADSTSINQTPNKS